MGPVLDPVRNLAGATPETLAAALLRNESPALRPGARRQAVVGNEVATEKVPADETERQPDSSGSSPR